jgi:hypothetical protein
MRFRLQRQRKWDLPYVRTLRSGSFPTYLVKNIKTSDWFTNRQRNNEYSRFLLMYRQITDALLNIIDIRSLWRRKTSIRLELNTQQGRILIKSYNCMFFLYFKIRTSNLFCNGFIIPYTHKKAYSIYVLWRCLQLRTEASRENIRRVMNSWQTWTYIMLLYQSESESLLAMSSPWRDL